MGNKTVLEYQKELEKVTNEGYLPENIEFHFRAVMQTSSDAIILSDKNGSILTWNNGAKLIFGYSEEEALGKSLTIIIPEKYRKMHNIGLQRVAEMGETRIMGKPTDVMGLFKDGTEGPIELSLSCWIYKEEVYFGAIIRDISEKKHAEKALKERESNLKIRNKELVEKNKQIENQKWIIENSLNEKKILLKEIHHRVKNNLQLVSGLIELQAAETNDEGVKKIMEQGQNRIRSMALIHQQLYESENLDKIEFREYVDKLIKDISVMINDESKQIDIKLDIPDFSLDIDTAVPMGLIINELIVNSFKHGFKNREKGTIDISLRSLEDDYFEMKVSDNGIGLSADFDLNNIDSLGLKLVQGLSRQIGGRCQFKNNSGTTVLVKFKNNNN